MTDDTRSIKSTQSRSSGPSLKVPKTPDGRKVGFGRPTLIIPPPQVYPSSLKSATLSSPAPSSHHGFYGRRGSHYMFNGIRDFTTHAAKSGLGIGEKSAYWLYNKVRSWSRKWFTHMFLTIVICIYTVGGALIFIAVEGPAENHVHEDLRKQTYDLIMDLHNLSIYRPVETTEEEWKGAAKNRVDEFKNYAIKAYQEKALIVANGEEKIWTFWNALVYCATIYTTIGYGHLYPTTAIGRAITIVYSIIGIPLFLLALTDFGKLFTRGIKFLWSFVRRLYYTGSCRRVRKTAHMEDIFKGAQMMYEIATFRRPSMFADPENPPTPGTTTIGEDTPTTPALSNFEIDDEFNLPISVAIFLLVAYIFLGALIYCMWEGWNFFTSFYFVFISMSTIGFGDYVPRNPICMIVSIVYLVFGLALMSMCINVVQLKLSDTFKHASVKIGATMGIRVSEDDGSISTVPPDQIEIPGIHDSKVEGDENQTGEKANDGSFEQTTFDFNKKS